MPNPNFCGPHDDMNLVDCHLSKTYKCCQPAEKVCRFAYASWCPVCDLESQRKRSKSESTEVNYRKRGRDNIKTPSPKKTDRTKGYYTENKDFTDSRDMKLDSSRVRTNLCELPTSYITGNCQINVPSSNDKSHSKKLLNGNMEYIDLPTNEQFRCPKSYSSEIGSNFESFLKNTSLSTQETPRYLQVKSADFKDRVNRHVHLSTPSDSFRETKTSFLHKVNTGSVKKAASKLCDLPVPHRDSLSPTKNKTVNNLNIPKENHIKENGKKSPNGVIKKTDSTLRPLTAKPESPKKISKITPSEKLSKSPNQVNKFTLAQNDEEFSSSIPELDTPLELVKPPISELISQVVDEIPSPLFINEDLDMVDIKRLRVRQRSDSDNSNDQNIETIEDPQKNMKKKAREVSPLESKTLHSKSSVKFNTVKARHKLSSVKLRKVRSKIAHSVSSDSNLSDR